MSKNEIKLLQRITINPDICHGKPVIRNLRYPIENILELLSSGMSTQQILDDYSDLEKEDIQATMIYATNLAKTKDIFYFISTGLK